MYEHHARTVAILLGALGLAAYLDHRKWKLPRWPWAKDKKRDPPPTFVHENEMYSVDDLVDRKLMEILSEMNVHRGDDGVPWGTAVPELKQSETKVEKEAEEQFWGDAEIGIEDIVEEMDEAAL